MMHHTESSHTEVSATTSARTHLGSTMERQPITDLAKRGSGEAVTYTLKESVRFTHDILLLAANRGMDVWITTGSLQANLRDQFTKEMTGVDFAQSVREVLQA